MLCAGAEKFFEIWTTLRMWAVKLGLGSASRARSGTST